MLSTNVLTSLQTIYANKFHNCQFGKEKLKFSLFTDNVRACGENRMDSTNKTKQ